MLQKRQFGTNIVYNIMFPAKYITFLGQSKITLMTTVRTIAKSFHMVESAPTRLSRERTSPSQKRGPALGVLPSPRLTARIEQLCNRPVTTVAAVDEDVFSRAAPSCWTAAQQLPGGARLLYRVPLFTVVLPCVLLGSTVAGAPTRIFVKYITIRKSCRVIGGAEVNHAGSRR